jgi:hypothetical protein
LVLAKTASVSSKHDLRQWRSARQCHTTTRPDGMLFSQTMIVATLFAFGTTLVAAAFIIIIIIRRYDFKS